MVIKSSAIVANRHVAHVQILKDIFYGHIFQGSILYGIVEIIGVNPLKGTNETYMQDPYTGAWTLLDAFSIEGVRQ